VLGIYFSGHPLADYKEQFDKFSFNTGHLDFYEEDEEGNKTFTEVKDGESVVMGGIVTEFKRLSTRSGSTMGFLKVEDLYGQIEIIVFPKVYDKSRELLKEEEVVKVSGKIQIKDGVAQILADGIFPLEIKEEPKENLDQEFMGLIVPEGKEDKLNDLLDILSSYPGDIPVIVAMAGKKYNSHCAVRRCEGLMSELKIIVGENDIIFFKKSK
jgi:DNA polymerase-3 subunit alpha